VIDGAEAVGQVDVIASIARRVPMAVLAAGFGIADADRAADAAIVTAAAYFPGADGPAERAADSSTAELVTMLSPARQRPRPARRRPGLAPIPDRSLAAGRRSSLAQGLVLSPADEEIIVARIALMVQGCDATAGLISEAVRQALPPAAADSAMWSTEAIIAEVLRRYPPVPMMRRVSRTATELNGCPVPAGSAVLLRIDSANREPAVFDAPDRFDPGRSDRLSLTFGHGVRPCPADAHALMLAAGVVQAVRDRCTAVIGPVEFEPGGNVRLPTRLEVALS
jgi:cytochrome P450